MESLATDTGLNPIVIGNIFSTDQFANCTESMGYIRVDGTVTPDCSDVVAGIADNYWIYREGTQL